MNRKSYNNKYKFYTLTYNNSDGLYYMLNIINIHYINEF